MRKSYKIRNEEWGIEDKWSIHPNKFLSKYQAEFYIRTFKMFDCKVFQKRKSK